MLHWVSNPADMEAAFPKDSPEREVVRNIPSVWEETIGPSAVCHWGMRRLRPEVRKPVVHCSDERRRQGTHRFHSFEFPGQKHGIPGHHSPGSGGKNDGWSVETRKVTSGNALSFTMRIKGGGIVRMAPSGTRHPAPGREKEPPLFFPLQRRSGGKPCSSAATPPVSKKE